MKEIISVTDVHKSYKLGKNNFVHALRGATLSVPAGQMTAIMGPSGSGKSTLMHLMGCLDRPDKGEVRLCGERVDDLPKRKLPHLRAKKMGFIFQGFNLIPTLTALENVGLAAEYGGHSRKEAARAAEKQLAAVGLSDRLHHRPTELSGGQQHRVAIARALVNEPEVVFGDEPTGDLDTATSQEIIKMMKEINEATGTTFILVTHDSEVAGACGEVIHMRDGVIDGQPETRKSGAPAVSS